MNDIRSSGRYISASEAKEQISSLVKQVLTGSTFVITDDETGEPIAELVPVIEEETEIEEPICPNAAIEGDPEFSKFEKDGLKLLWK
jgi:antitoxin (DNA-binding transcriptional repressor) of toxin-antitoxin stability system